jgi:hypothetical protein
MEQMKERSVLGMAAKIGAMLQQLVAPLFGS